MTRIPVSPGEFSRSEVEHPKLLDLLSFWEGRRGARSMPCRSDFDVLEWAPWFGNLILLESAKPGGNLVYRVYGTNLVRLLQHDRTNKTIGELKTSAREDVMAEYASVIEWARPLYVRQRRKLLKGQLLLSKLVLPLSEDGHRVDRLLAGVYPSDVDVAEDWPDRVAGFIDPTEAVAAAAAAR